MIFHHLGVACKNIKQAIEQVQKIYNVQSISEIYYDDLQEAELCLINTTNNIVLELITGKVIADVLKKGIVYYHICYSVIDLEGKIKELVSNGCIVVSSPKPAKLFNNRRVAFLVSSIGLIELLEEG